MPAIPNRTPLSHEDLAAMDRRSLFHPFTALGDHERDGPPIIIRSGEGVRVTDANGKKYIDAMAGLWCVNVGYGRESIANAMADQAKELCYFHAFSSMSSEPPIILADRLIDLAKESVPQAEMSKVFFGNSGSDANDTQVKLVWYYNNARGKPQKKKIIARERGYHGVTIMSAGMTGLPGLHSGFDLPLPFVKHVKAPHRLWQGYGLSDESFVALLMEDLEALIAREGANTIGAMIAEPVMGAGGVIVPPKGYFKALQEVLSKHDILLIADEVICGFGRLGAMFGAEALGMTPDLMTTAKGITSAYTPLSACLVSERVWRTIVDAGAELGPFGHGYTYTAHPIAAAAALANLDIIEQEGLVDVAASQGDYLHRTLRKAFSEHPLVGEIRGQSLIAGVEFVARRDPPEAFDPTLKVAARVVKAMLTRGVISRALPNSDTVAFSPPFIATRTDIDQMVTVARDAADEVADALKKEGVEFG